MPPGYAYGFSGGPAFDTRIGSSDGGGEHRLQTLEEPRWRWSALRRNFSEDADVDGLADWFLARRGAMFGFLFLDPADYSTNGRRGVPTSLDQVIGFGDGVTTRFRLRKQYPDPGGMTARAFPRRVVPMLGNATAPVAAILNVDPGASIAPVAAVAGVIAAGATFLPLSQEVVLSSPPAVGAQVTWGGYFCVPVRFADSTDKGFEATIAGFRDDQAAFEIDGIPFDDPVPLVPGGSPFGAEVFANQATDLELTGRGGFLKEIEAVADISGFLDDLDNYPTGGPHMFIANTGTNDLTIRDSLGNAIDTILANGKAWLLVKEDGSGNRTPLLAFA